ncbi:TraB/GumN family protein [Sphingomonas quercus]|uniref:TraB/GumN family protein n=1 Tax=Sphingomonas quercus TaxID=2842451 RepID=A0ABS6BIN8_9SPHN|nr:TraB/GumN family protein [Sphingomonas quercus]MBU3077681.1 TraB/GumN family protein [Sphingomonas quercus]
MVDESHPLLDAQISRRQVLGSSALALSAAPAIGAVAHAAPLWTVRKGGRSIYVLGESLPRPIDWHNPIVEALLLRCGRLWTETNQIYRNAATDLAKAFGMSGSSSPLGLLSPAQMARVKKAAAMSHVSLDELDGARPWLVGATLEDAGYQTAGLIGKSANAILSAQAMAADIPVSSEFAVKDDVFAWFGGMTAQQDAQFLCFCADGVVLGRAGSERISASWLSGQLGPALDFVRHEEREYPELYEKLTVARNHGWIPRFEGMLREPKPTLVVVGLYHLVGPESLLVQARNAGFTVSYGI